MKVYNILNCSNLRKSNDNITTQQKESRRNNILSRYYLLLHRVHQ